MFGEEYKIKLLLGNIFLKNKEADWIFLCARTWQLKRVV
jgi:hypothetical protein